MRPHIALKHAVVRSFTTALLSLTCSHLPTAGLVGPSLLDGPQGRGDRLPLDSKSVLAVRLSRQRLIREVSGSSLRRLS